MSNNSGNSQYFSGMPAPSQGRRGPVHPDGYQTAPRPAGVTQDPYGNGVDYNIQPKQFSGEVNLPGYQQPNHQQQNYGHPGSPSMLGVHPAGTGYATQYASYGNPFVIRVSDPNWVSNLLLAMQQQQEIDLVFDGIEVINHLVEAVREQVGSFADIAARRIRDAIGFAMAQNAHRGYNQPAAEVMIAPAIAAAIIAAIVVVGLSIIYAVIVLVGQRNQIDAIRTAAEHCRYGLRDVKTASQNQGQGGDSWFNFLNGSTIELRCNEQ